MSIETLDSVTLLDADRRKVDALLRQFALAKDTEAKQAIALQIRTQLMVYAVGAPRYSGLAVTVSPRTAASAYRSGH